MAGVVLVMDDATHGIVTELHSHQASQAHPSWAGGEVKEYDVRQVFSLLRFRLRPAGKVGRRSSQTRGRQWMPCENPSRSV